MRFATVNVRHEVSAHHLRPADALSATFDFVVASLGLVCFMLVALAGVFADAWLNRRTG